jgi:hypothetical protein
LRVDALDAGERFRLLLGPIDQVIVRGVRFEVKARNRQQII